MHLRRCLLRCCFCAALPRSDRIHSDAPDFPPQAQTTHACGGPLTRQGQTGGEEHGPSYKHAEIGSGVRGPRQSLRPQCQRATIN
jgi:hypothetical protein